MCTETDVSRPFRRWLGSRIMLESNPLRAEEGEEVKEPVTSPECT